MSARIAAIGRNSKTFKHGKISRRCYFKNSSITIRATTACKAIKISVRAFDKFAKRILAIWCSVQLVKYCDVALRCHFENRTAINESATGVCHPIKIAVATQ